MSEPARPEIGREYPLSVQSLAFGGEGVARLDGLTVFVPDVCAGERVTARITEVHKSYARAELVRVEQPAPERVAPFCPLSGTCGGCHLQHLDYPAQLAAKAGVVRDALERVGRLPDVPVADVVPSPLPLGYRNKAELHAFDEDGRLSLGFYRRGDEALVAVSECPLCLPEVNALLGAVTAWLRETGWPPYDPHTSGGLVRTVGLRYAVATREANLLLVTGRRDLPGKRPAFEALRKEFPPLVGIRHVARTRASQSRLGRQVGEMIGRAMRFRFGELSLRVSPEAFYQVNDLLLETLWEHLRTALEPRPEDQVADVYGGVGTWGLRLAAEVARVVVIEIDGAAVRDAEANVRFNEIENVEVLRGQAEQQLPAAFPGPRADLVILDPPRKGCSETALRAVAKQSPRRIAYLACDPATLARDLARLAELGYRTVRVQPFDLFPQTYHVECLATLAPR